MKEWTAVTTVVVAFIAGGFALVLASSLLWATAIGLLLAGLAAGAHGGWGSAQSTSQHPHTITGWRRS